jgi:pimeloyl-ACP methyl ester carboxylesterase
MHALLMLLLAANARVESKFEQVLPEPPLGKLMARSEGVTRAIVLVHGLHPHPFSSDNVTRAQFRDWQAAESKLARDLVKLGDVFAFAYAQDIPVEDVATRSELGDNVAELRKRGYTDIVLVGHSAGGVVAREFVEDNPNAGVTRVIQVCSPNGGSNWARVPYTVRRAQVPFLKSLTKDSRRKILEKRSEKRIPETVQFACIVGIGTKGGDGFVARDCQWTECLQRQGIPAVAVDVTHVTAMRNGKATETIGKLIVDDLKRWEQEKVTQTRKEIFAD